jgi:hypothetical protein
MPTPKHVRRGTTHRCTLCLARSEFALGVGCGLSFNGPLAVATDKKGNYFVADTGNHCIRIITPAPHHSVGLLAGAPKQGAGDADGVGSSARFHSPSALCVDEGHGVLFVCDSGRWWVAARTEGGSRCADVVCWCVVCCVLCAGNHKIKCVLQSCFHSPTSHCLLPPARAHGALRAAVM